MAKIKETMTKTCMTDTDTVSLYSEQNVTPTSLIGSQWVRLLSRLFVHIQTTHTPTTTYQRHILANMQFMNTTKFPDGSRRKCCVKCYCKTRFCRVPFISRISWTWQVRGNDGPRKFEYSSVSVK